MRFTFQINMSTPWKISHMCMQKHVLSFLLVWVFYVVGSNRVFSRNSSRLADSIVLNKTWCIQKIWQALFSSVYGNVLFSFPKLYLKIDKHSFHILAVVQYYWKKRFFTSYKAAGRGMTGCIWFQSQTAMFSAVLTFTNTRWKTNTNTDLHNY